MTSTERYRAALHDLQKAWIDARCADAAGADRALAELQKTARAWRKQLRRSRRRTTTFTPC